MWSGRTNKKAADPGVGSAALVFGPVARRLVATTPCCGHTSAVIGQEPAEDGEARALLPRARVGSRSDMPGHAGALDLVDERHRDHCGHPLRGLVVAGNGLVKSVGEQLRDWRLGR